MLRLSQFIRVNNKGEWFEDGDVIYAKEIKMNIFLVFIFLNTSKKENIKALIAEFTDLKSIGKIKPLRTMFYLIMNENKDFHCFEHLIKTSDF
ncbi:hypothetical protein [Chryseobacterium oleae]|nr:hypothetical protein [Chryseobacterium oleae]